MVLEKSGQRASLARHSEYPNAFVSDMQKICVKPFAPNLRLFEVQRAHLFVLELAWEEVVEAEVPHIGLEQWREAEQASCLQQDMAQ